MSPEEGIGVKPPVDAPNSRRRPLKYGSAVAGTILIVAVVFMGLASYVYIRAPEEPFPPIGIFTLGIFLLVVAAFASAKSSTGIDKVQQRTPEAQDMAGTEQTLEITQNGKNIGAAISEHTQEHNSGSPAMQRWEYLRVMVHWSREGQTRGHSQFAMTMNDNFVFEHNGTRYPEAGQLDKLLCILGEQGWELVTSTPFVGSAVESIQHWSFTDTYRYDLIFKRPKQAT